MSIESSVAIRLIGLPVLQQDGATIGTVTNVSAGDEGRITNLCVRLGWMAEERWLSTAELKFQSDCAITRYRREQLQSRPVENATGIVGIDVRSRDGESLGKITNVLADATGLNVVGLELSNGLVKDWARGRSLVVVRPEDGLGEINECRVVLAEEAHPISTRNEAAARSVAEVSTGPGAHPIDWDAVRKTSEDEVAARMARIIWERRGAPGEREGDAEWLEKVRPWAAKLKKAAETGQGEAFDDPALLSSEQIEALRPFRVGLEPLERNVGASPPESRETAGKRE